MEANEEAKMMNRWHKMVVVGGLAVAVLVPSGAAFAATTGAGGTTAAAPACSGDGDMLRLRDGTGWRHTTAGGMTVAVQPVSGSQHRSGPQNGTGPMADRVPGGTGNQWRGGR